MKKKFPILDLRLPVDPASVRASFFQIANRKSQIANGFTLIEVMVVMALLSLIIIALMGVFNTTQAAFRASVTQTDVLEGGRAAMDLITSDLRAMSPSDGVSNSASAFVNFGLVPVNFYVSVNNASAPLVQSLIASGFTRTNVVESFFLLSRNNQTLTGVGYYVDTASSNGINPLYRFSMSTNVSAVNGAARLYYNFQNTPLTNSPPWSRLLDGVVGFRLRAYDPNGIWLTNGYSFPTIPAVKNTFIFHSTLGQTLGEAEFYMFSNTLPASVEIEMATLEDRTLQRAESLPNDIPAPPPNDRRTIYLQGQAGKLHIFRQRVTIPNVDPAAYR